MGKLETIKWNNKEYKIPASFANNIDSEQALNMTTCTNPYSGEKCELPDFAATICYNIKDAEWAEEYKIVQQGCDWFSRNFAKEYMVLLD